MDSKLHTEEESEGRGWSFSRRRKLAAAVVGVMMMGIAADMSHDLNAPVSDTLPDDSEMVIIDDFDRIDALLASAETPKVNGRGPTVEVPSELSQADKRPVFDFDSFDRRYSDSPESPGDDRNNSESQETKAPKREAFSEAGGRQELLIPEARALGQGHRVLVAGDEHLAPARKATSKLQIQNSAELPSPPPRPAPVRIVTSEVTASPVTRFAVEGEELETNTSSHIQFTGNILPVSRPTDTK